MKKNRYHLPTSKHIPNSKHLPILVKCAPLKSKLNPYLHKNGKPTLLSKIITHRRIMICGGFGLAALLWDSDAFAANSIRGLETQLDHINTFTTSKVATTGFTLAVIVGAITAAFKGSVALAISIFAIGIITVYYLDWIKTAFSAAGAA